MIKVLQVSSDTNIGGAGKCILTYLKHFDKTKIDTAVVLPKNSLLKKRWRHWASESLRLMPWRTSLWTSRRLKS